MKPRPLSPHLQIYKWQITMIMSIGHRASGIALACGSLLVVIWLASLALGPNAYNYIHLIITHWFGQFVLFGYSLVIFYHLLNGIRHLSWDFGYGYEIKSVYFSGYLVFFLSFIFTLTIWIFSWLF
tara:strand:- start:286 stop:663 length:378 start_codon:yes stop_codon:yes gene_type:complete